MASLSTMSSNSLGLRSTLDMEATSAAWETSTWMDIMVLFYLSSTYFCTGPNLACNTDTYTVHRYGLMLLSLSSLPYCATVTHEVCAKAVDKYTVLPTAVTQ